MFLKWWKEILLVLLVIAILGYWYHLTSTIDNQKVEIAQHQAQIVTLSTAVETQNTAIAQMKVDSDTRAEAGRIAQQQAETRAAVNKKRASDLASVLAKYPSDLCRSANELIDGELK